MADVHCPKSGDFLWQDSAHGGFPTSFGTMVYSEGDCWVLAWYLRAALLERNMESRIFLAGSRNNWYHVAVEFEDGILDIEGLSKPEEFEDRWPQWTTYLEEEDLLDFEEYRSALDAEFVFDAGHPEAKAVAAALVEREIDEA